MENINKKFEEACNTRDAQKILNVLGTPDMVLERVKNRLKKEKVITVENINLRTVSSQNIAIGRDICKTREKNVLDEIMSEIIPLSNKKLEEQVISLLFQSEYYETDSETGYKKEKKSKSIFNDVSYERNYLDSLKPLRRKFFLESIKQSQCDIKKDLYIKENDDDKILVAIAESGKDELVEGLSFKNRESRIFDAILKKQHSSSSQFHQCLDIKRNDFYSTNVAKFLLKNKEKIIEQRDSFLQIQDVSSIYKRMSIEEINNYFKYTEDELLRSKEVIQPQHDTPQLISTRNNLLANDCALIKQGMEITEKIPLIANKTKRQQIANASENIWCRICSFIGITQAQLNSAGVKLSLNTYQELIGAGNENLTLSSNTEESSKIVTAQLKQSLTKTPLPVVNKAVETANEKEQILGENYYKLVSCLSGASVYKFSDLVAELKKKYIELTIEDFDYKTRDVAIGEVIANFGDAKNVFVPELWKDNLETAQALFDKYFTADRHTGFDFRNFENAVNRLEGKEVDDEISKLITRAKSWAERRVEENKTIHNGCKGI